MKKSTRLFASTLTISMLAGAMQLPVCAAETSNEGLPFAEILYQAEHDPEVFSYWSTPLGDKDFICYEADSFHDYRILELSYTITVEPGTELPEGTKEKLLDAVTKSTAELQAIAQGSDHFSQKRVICDTETDESGAVNPISLVQLNDTTYQFRVDPYWFLTDDDVLTRFWQTVPGFVSIQKNAVGYDFAHMDYNLISGFTSDENGGYFSGYWETAPISLHVDKADEILTAADFPEELHVQDVVFSEYTSTDSDGNTYTYRPGGFYRVYLENDAYENQLSCAEMYEILQGFREMDIFTNVTRQFSIKELWVDPTPYLIDNGAMTFATRGDCDRDEAITMQDAYQALIANSTEAAGGTAALSGREALAADVDGDGNISMNDAYRILLYSSTRSAGAEASWAEILQ